MILKKVLIVELRLAFRLSVLLIDRIQASHLDFVRKFKPDIVILELGTNDSSRPEVIGSAIDDLFKGKITGACCLRVSCNTL